MAGTGRIRGGTATRERTLLVVDGDDDAGHSVRSIVAALVPMHSGRVVDAPDGTTAAEFVTIDGALDAAAAVLRSLHDRDQHGVRLAICSRPSRPIPDGGRTADHDAVVAALELLVGARSGTVVLSPDAALALSDDPMLSVRSLELVARDRGEVPAALDDISRRREVRVGGIRFAGRRRRPSGERAPLPRELRLSGRLAIAVTVLIALLWVLLFLVPDTVQWWQDRDNALLMRVVAWRRAWATELASVTASLGSAWFWRTLRIGALLVLVGFRRWRHLLVALLSLFLLETLVEGMANAIGRPRPLVPIIGTWEGYAHPSGAVASLTVSLAIVALALLPARPWRRWWTVGGVVVVTAVVLARVYLGLDHLTDGVIAALLGVAVPLVAFRYLAPEQVFPISYRRRGRGAHLDIDDRRSAAIRQAMLDQLGFEVVDIEPFGLEASAGSTPLRLTVAGDGDRFLFAKLYSTSHLRADRWYKALRTILYGTLEDELRHPSVRRLVEREDYLLLTMFKAGIPCARPYGVVEITPEREYLTVTEFIDGAEEISTAEVDDQVIDEALTLIRRLWDAGLAHRDIKPGNVLVQDGHVRLVDVAFAMVRPSPWRQAVDLANMMIILALRSTPEHVYERALRTFAPEDIAEAFAATRSVTIPSESRSSLRVLARTHGLDVVGRFEQLSPSREPITIQRWNRRRITLTFAALFLLAMLLPILAQNIVGAGFL